jgi:catechol 2,3-dioxygenase-like lactoylglutathione lyase family enzyme
MKLDKLPKVEHVGIIVPDMDKARAELRMLFGERPGLDFVYDFFPDRVWTDGREISEKCQLRLCMVDWVDGMRMEVIQPVLGNDLEHARFLREIGGGLHHIAYYVREGWAEYRQYVLDQGARVLFESETNDDRGYRRCCYLKCPDSGLVVEIAEPPAPHKK